jgi:hypothetical protein
MRWRKARPIVLEPIVNVQILAPEGKMGDIAGELSGHRGQIKGSDSPRPARCRSTRRRRSPSSSISPRGLKSITAGHGSYTLEFSHYDPAPPMLQQKLIAAHKPAAARRGLDLFIGHAALAFAAKPLAPRASLAVLLAATYWLDMVWPVLLLAGIEHVRIDPGNTAFTPLDFWDYPWSHSLVLAAAWSVLFGLACISAASA